MMVRQPILFFLTALALLAGWAAAQDKPKVEFRDGERIVFLGNEFFEREADRCYIETELTTRFPEKNLTFRNLGYSGDTVKADARNLCSGWAVFGPADQGFDRLKNLIEHIKPTLIFVAYGMNESFEGPRGLPAFEQGLRRMLDMLVSQSSSGVRIVLVSPIRHENLGPPLPDPTEHNRNIQLYTKSMEKIADERSCAFINLFQELGDGTQDAYHTAYTSDGIHLTPYGYWRAAMVFEQACGYSPRTYSTHILPKGNGVRCDGPMLPLSPPPDGAPPELSEGRAVLPGQAWQVRLDHLDPGNYTLSFDGKSLASAPAKQWSAGVPILKGPLTNQEETLRKAIVAKNFDFFNFWRPDNDTYIFGYRKHEQGRNAIEIPRFEPLVAQKEAEIAKLRVPVPHDYVLESHQK